MPWPPLRGCCTVAAAHCIAVSVGTHDTTVWLNLKLAISLIPWDVSDAFIFEHILVEYGLFSGIDTVVLKIFVLMALVGQCELKLDGLHMLMVDQANMFMGRIDKRVDAFSPLMAHNVTEIRVDEQASEGKRAKLTSVM